jgi:hypothetical protein
LKQGIPKDLTSLCVKEYMSFADSLVLSFPIIRRCTEGATLAAYISPLSYKWTESVRIEVEVEGCPYEEYNIGFLQRALLFSFPKTGIVTIHVRLNKRYWETCSILVEAPRTQLREPVKIEGALSDVIAVNVLPRGELFLLMNDHSSVLLDDDFDEVFGVYHEKTNMEGVSNIIAPYRYYGVETFLETPDGTVTSVCQFGDNKLLVVRNSKLIVTPYFEEKVLQMPRECRAQYAQVDREKKNAVIWCSRCNELHFFKLFGWDLTLERNISITNVKGLGMTPDGKVVCLTEDSVKLYGKTVSSVLCPPGIESLFVTPDSRVGLWGSECGLYIC